MTEKELQDFIILENKIRRLFKQKLDSMQHISGYEERIEAASKLWREDKEVASTLEALQEVADKINRNFTKYKLESVLRLWYFFIGLHEEWFFNHDGSHSLFDLIVRPTGYSFNCTMAFVCNRFGEAKEGKEVYANLNRIEMSLAYLLIFISRLLYSPYIKNKDVDFCQNIRVLAISDLINNNIPLPQISREKCRFLRVLEGVKGEVISNTLTKEKWRELVSIALQNLVNLISISDYLKNEVYDADWQLLRPSFFEISREGLTTKAMMCRIYEGQISSPEFPFESLEPKEFLMYF